MSNHTSSFGGWSSVPRNSNIYAHDDIASQTSRPMTTTFFSSSVSSSPCSFISAISTIEDGQDGKALDEHELVSCSFTATRTTFTPEQDASEADESSNSVSWIKQGTGSHSHLNERNWRQNQCQELTGDEDQIQSSALIKDLGQSFYRPIQSHVYKCDSDHDHYRPEQVQDITPILPTPFPSVTSCFYCLSVPITTSLSLAPESAHIPSPNSLSTPISSSLPSSGMCPHSSLPRRRYRTISSAVASLGIASALSSMSSTSGGSGQGSNALVSSLALFHPVQVNNDCDIISSCNNININITSPVLQPYASIPQQVKRTAEPLLTTVTTTSLLSLSKDSCQLDLGFSAPDRHLSIQHNALQQFTVDSEGETTRIPPVAQKAYIQYRSTVNDTESDMMSLPESPTSSNSSPAILSPSTSITWASPSAANQGSLKPISHFASLSEHGERSQNKGKGVMRAYRYNRRHGRACFDGLPREIKIHTFRYLSTFQLVRISRVSRSWRGLAMDGSLWKAIDAARYYKTIQDSQLRILGTAASGFLRYANFRGCAQLSGDSLSAIAEHCPNIERLNLTGCRSITSKSIDDVCMNMHLLVHLDLAGLHSVNNHTLQTMTVYCRSLQVLNLAWCKQISGSGLVKLTGSCQELRKLNISGCLNLEDRLMPMMGMNLPKLRELCLNGCSSLTDRGLIGLLSGLSVGSSKKHRKWRLKKRLSSSVRVSSLGHLLINQSSCNDDENEDDEEEQEKDDTVKEEESDSESNADEGAVDGEDGNDVIDGSTAHPTSNTSNQISQGNQDGLQARLVYLGLSQCRLLTHEALRAIGHLCGTHLRRLELSNCDNFGDEGLIYLAQHCSRLRLLDLEEVSLLTDASLRAFAMNLPKLERICLSYCENVTDQGIMRMLRPISNPTTTTIINADTASLYCRKLVHLELDNCLLITDRILLEFANVLEERAAASMERQKEREKKREERRERIRQKKRAAVPRKISAFQLDNKDEEENAPRSSCEHTEAEHGQDAQATGPSSVAPAIDVSFISSTPVNIPNRFRHIPAIAGSTQSYSSSPLQPRSVLASTLLSEEIVIKKTRPGTRIMVPTRSTSTSSTASNTSLNLWHPEPSSRRNSSLVVNGNGVRRAIAKKPIRPTIQVFDCRNITLRGVEAAQTRCSSLTIRSYYSWTHPSTSAPTTSATFGGSGATEGIDGGEEEDDDEDGDSDNNVNSSQTSLHHLQLQQQHLQQHLQNRNRASNLLRRARLGLINRTGGAHEVQCLIL
ncbi:hypothetical protein BGZ46_008607 [Entomortierella lignicola]|nr:hypothetical protein BGZ46_008607 [Entomortierella lignicola]